MRASAEKEDDIGDPRPVLIVGHDELYRGD